MDRRDIQRELREEYESRWRAGDPWSGDALEGAHAARKNLLQAEVIGDRRYRRTLEVACGNGNLTPTLAVVSDAVLAIDISAAALGNARSACAQAAHVSFEEADAVPFDYVARGPWDLITLVESIYSFGWLYPLFDIGWMATQMAESLAPSGRLLLTNTYGSDKDHLLRPYLIDTYRDLFRNVGLGVLREQVLPGDSTGSLLPALITLFEKDEDVSRMVAGRPEK